MAESSYARDGPGLYSAGLPECAPQASGGCQPPGRPVTIDGVYPVIELAPAPPPPLRRERRDPQFAVGLARRAGSGSRHGGQARRRRDLQLPQRRERTGWSGRKPGLEAGLKFLERPVLTLLKAHSFSKKTKDCTGWPLADVSQYLNRASLGSPGLASLRGDNPSATSQARSEGIRPDQPSTVSTSLDGLQTQASSSGSRTMTAERPDHPTASSRFSRFASNAAAGVDSAPEP